MSTAPERAARPAPAGRSPATVGWWLPLVLVALVWGPIVGAWRAGVFRPWDEAVGRSDPERLAFSARLALQQFQAGSCGFGLWILRQVEVREPYVPEWTLGEAVACFEAAGEPERALELVEEKCAGRVSDAEIPVPAFRRPPAYPVDARDEGTEGWVQVGYDISPGGAVEDLAVQKADPEGVFDAAALAVVRSWRFCPGPGHRDIEVVLRFEMDDEDAAAP